VIQVSKIIVSWLLIVVLSFGFSVGASAATSATTEKNTENMTLEERINGLELTPQPRPDWAKYHDWYDFSRVDKVISEGLSNYEAMKAVFLDVAQNCSAISCTSHQKVLMGAFEMIGFKVHPVWGMTTTKDGKALAGTYGFPEGWTGHSWVAVEIDGLPNVVTYDSAKQLNPRDVVLNDGVDVSGEILYFDSNLHGTYGMSYDHCFAVSPQNATWYQYASVNLI